MSRTARVTSTERLEQFRSSLCEFGKDVKDVLCAVDMHLRRMFDWLEERTKFWKHEIRVRQEALVRAKIELEQRKYMDRDGRGPGHTNQEKEFRKAQARLKEAEEKLTSCRKWHPLLQHAVKEYQGPARQLTYALDIELVHSLNLLDQKLGALEAYLATAPPSTALPATPASGNDSMATSQAADEPRAPAKEDENQHTPPGGPGTLASGEQIHVHETPLTAPTAAT